MGRGLTLQEFAARIGEDPTVLCRIERGERYPPKQRIKKFAQVLSLTHRQLEVLIAVERRGLNPHVLLPEIPPAKISNTWIENAAQSILSKFCRVKKLAEVKLPVPVEEVISIACGLSTQHCDFASEMISGSSGGALYGGLYPDGFRGKDRLVVVNSGPVQGNRLSSAEKRVTVAHEAGHYVLHCGNRESKQLFFRFTKGPTFCREAECEQTPFNSLEYQASAFGACLVMPRERFGNMWAPGAAAKLATSFLVTESFVRLRAKMLDL
jgi:transcriptional regulator with XRE-family HTH domain